MERFRGTVLPILIGVAAVLVSIAAMLFIAENVRLGRLGHEASGHWNAPGARNAPDTPGGSGPGGTPRSFGGQGGSLLGVTIDEQSGALKVTTVLPNSPAASAGVQAGDEVMQVNGTAVKTTADVRAAVAAVKPGASYDLQVRRNNNLQVLKVLQPASGRGTRPGAQPTPATTPQA